MESVPVATTQVARERVRSTERLRRELVRALRSSARNPGFAAIVIVTLALSIGAATALFTMLDRVVLQPLPYQDASRLVWLDSPTPKIKPDSRWGLSAAEFFLFKDNAHTLRGIAAIMPARATVTRPGSTERVPMADVSASVFDVLRLRPMLGRALSPSDNLLNAPRVVVLGYDYWKTQLNGDPHVLGSMISIATTPHQVVGVMGPDATIPDVASPRVDLWLPAELDPSAPPVNAHYLPVVARLAPGATAASAEAELAGLTAQLPARFPTAYGSSFFRETGFRTAVTPLQKRIVGDLATRLWILLGAVLVVLLIACGNVANLFLVRAESRRREVAIRGALGARRRDLAWQYFTESIFLTLLAGVVALALAAIGLHTITAIAPAELPRLGEVHVGGAEVSFTVLLSVTAGIVFGALMLLGVGTDTGAQALRAGGRGSTASPGQHLARGILAAAQTALALVLLAGAGLLLESFHHVSHISPGFDATNVLTVEVSLPSARYMKYEPTEAFYHTLLERAAAIPGVTAVGAGDVVPLGPSTDGTAIGGFTGCSTVHTERSPSGLASHGGCIGTHTVAPGYFRALGIRVRGSEPSWSDVERRAGDVVVTRALAERMWPGEDAIGQGIRGGGKQPPFYRVVGVADDIHGTSLTDPPSEAVFFPMLPIVGAPLWSPARDMTVVLRTTGAPATVAAAVRHIATTLDPDAAIGSVQPMSTIVTKSMAALSFTMALLVIAAIFALILSAIGIYGVISYVVSHRTAEIGIRMALGAHASRVGQLVVWQSVRLAALGIAVGIVGALAMSRVLRSVLFDVSPNDPIVLVVVSAIMFVIAALASYAPASRAMRVDPVEALRAE